MNPLCFRSRRFPGIHGASALRRYDNPHGINRSNSYLAQVLPCGVLTNKAPILPAGDQLHLFLGRRQEQPYFHTGKRIAYKNKAGGILHIKPYHNSGRRHSNGNRRSNGNGGSQQQRAKDSSHRIVSLVRFFVISTRILIFPVSGARTVPFPHSPQHFSSPEGFPCRFS